MHLFRARNKDCIYTVDSCNFNALIDSYEVLNVAFPQSIDPLSLQTVNSKQTVETNRQLSLENRFVNQIHPNDFPQSNSFFGSSKFKILIIILISLILVVLIFILIVGLLLALSKFNSSNLLNNSVSIIQSFECYSSTYSVILNQSSIIKCDLSNSFTTTTTNNNSNFGSCLLSYTIEKEINFSYLQGV